MTAEQIEREAFNLSQVERGALAAKLVASLDEPGPDFLEEELGLALEETETFLGNLTNSLLGAVSGGRRH